MNFHGDFATTDWICLRQRVEIAKENDWAYDESQYEQSQRKPNYKFLPERLGLAQFVPHVVFIHAFGYVHVGLDLGQLDPLKHIESRFGESPIDYRPKLEDKRDG